MTTKGALDAKEDTFESMMAIAEDHVAAPEIPRARAKQYSRSRLTVGVLRLVLAFAFLLLFLTSGASDRLHSFFGGVTDNFYLQLSGYLLAFTAIYYLFFLGLDFYADVVLERRYGLSNQTVARWLGRSAKQGALSALIVLPVFDPLYLVIRRFPHHWWLLASVGWFILMIAASKITPAVILPLFYKLHPLEDRELVDRLFALAKRCGVRIRQVFEIRLSRETKKANAAVVGLGRNRKIVIGDTLLDMCSHDEIEAVFAHELGHVALHHAWKMLTLAAASSVAAFYLLHLFFERSTTWFGFGGAHDIAAFPLLLLWLGLLGLVFKPLQAAYSRHIEKQADLFIFGRIEKPDSLVSALTKLADRNLADPEPNRWVEWFFYDHPPIAKRIAYLQKSARK
jgi:STE24 endopeptidase